MTDESSIHASASIPNTGTQTSTTDQLMLTAKLGRAFGIIISASGNSPLRVVADVDSDPGRMLYLLDARYASSRTSSRTEVQTRLFRMSYTTQNIAKYIHEYTNLFSQLEFIGSESAIRQSHKVPMLLASIDPICDLELTAAALRTKDGADLTWEDVTTALIDEYNARRKICQDSRQYRYRKGKRARD